MALTLRSATKKPRPAVTDEALKRTRSTSPAKKASLKPTDDGWDGKKVVAAACLLEGLHWANAGIIAAGRDFLPVPGHWIVDVLLHTLLHIVIMGVATFRLRDKRQLVIIAVLRLALEFFFFLDDDNSYGRLLPPKNVWSMRPGGTLGYVLGELFIVAAAAAWSNSGKASLKENADFRYQITASFRS